MKTRLLALLFLFAAFPAFSADRLWLGVFKFQAFSKQERSLGGIFELSRDNVGAVLSSLQEHGFSSRKTFVMPARYNLGPKTEVWIALLRETPGGPFQEAVEEGVLSLYRGDERLVEMHVPLNTLELPTVAQTGVDYTEGKLKIDTSILENLRVLSQEWTESLEAASDINIWLTIGEAQNIIAPIASGRRARKILGLRTPSRVQLCWDRISNRAANFFRRPRN